MTILYRAQITESPEFETYYAFDYDRDRHETHVEWSRPVDWEASEDYIEQRNTDKFFEPSTDKWYRSRSSAAGRVALLESMGYRAVVQQSAPVQWPADGQKKVNDSESRRVMDAIRTLVKAGVVKSADDLL